MKIIFTKTIDVPAGPYCDNCEHLRSSSTNVSWADGLGSPGSITHYSCNAFGVGLSQDILDKQDTPTGYRKIINKSEECKKLSG